MVVVCGFTTGQSVIAQTPTPHLTTSCNPWVIQALPTEISFRQRVCLGIAEIASPGLALGSGFVAGLSQWRNSPKINPRDGDDYAVRYEHIYERQMSRIMAQVLVGAMRHEDPRYHPSKEKAAWRRIGSAFLSVVDSPGENGEFRPALAPLAGSLGSGLTSIALYQRQNDVSAGLRRSGLVYSTYFVKALFHEFSPELWSLTPGFVRKRHEAIRKAMTL
jgi:hypothetical protein